MADYEDTKVTDLIINNMSQEKFDELKSAGELDPTQIYLTPTEESGGASLPDQTGNGGKFLQTNGTDVSWGEALVNYGYKQNSPNLSGLWIGNKYTSPNGTVGNLSIALGGGRATAERAIQIGSSYEHSGITFVAENTTANTMKVAVESGNFEIMSADGTIPTDRYTITPTTAGTYVPKLTIAEDGTATREWGAESGGAGGDYLPLSGGEISGAINYNIGELQSYTWSEYPMFTATFVTTGGAYTYNEVGLYASANGIVLGHKGESSPLLSFQFQAKKIEPDVTGVELGTVANIFKSVATKKIVSGIDTSDYSANEIIVPQKKGTMALKEDIQEALKNITVDDDTDSVALGHEASGVEGIAIGAYSRAGQSTAIGYAAESDFGGLAIGDEAKAGALGIALGYQAVAGNTEFVVGINGNNIKITDDTGLFPRERMSALVEVLPTAENGYTTVKNYGNGYVEISGCAFFGSTAATVQSISFPDGYQFDTESPCPYFASVTACCKDDLTITSVSANVTRTGALDFDVFVNPESEISEGFYISWEVRGMLLTE